MASSATHASTVPSASSAAAAPSTTPVLSSSAAIATAIAGDKQDKKQPNKDFCTILSEKMGVTAKKDISLVKELCDILGNDFFTLSLTHRVDHLNIMEVRVRLIRIFSEHLRSPSFSDFRVNFLKACVDNDKNFYEKIILYRTYSQQIDSKFVKEAKAKLEKYCPDKHCPEQTVLLDKLHFDFLEKELGGDFFSLAVNDRASKLLDKSKIIAQYAKNSSCGNETGAFLIAAVGNNAESVKSFYINVHYGWCMQQYRYLPEPAAPAAAPAERETLKVMR